MIGKKLLAWIGAGMLSAACIPAVAATVSHRTTKAPMKTAHLSTVHHRASIKPAVRKATKLSTRRVSHVALAKPHAAPRTHVTHVAHVTHVTHRATTVHAIHSMHSGHATLAKKPVVTAAAKASHATTAKVTTVKATTSAPKAKVTGHLLTATTTVKKSH